MCKCVYVHIACVKTTIIGTRSCKSSGSVCLYRHVVLQDPVNFSREEFRPVFSALDAPKELVSRNLTRADHLRGNANSRHFQTHQRILKRHRHIGYSMSRLKANKEAILTALGGQEDTVTEKGHFRLQTSDRVPASNFRNDANELLILKLIFQSFDLFLAWDHCPW